MKPLVSILIPAYNAQDWIAEAILSALGQTWERKEIIVVDDGSTDKTLAIARQFESDHLHVVTQRNQGAAAARNAAFALSRGEYIQWLDADDLLSPTKIARQIEHAQAPAVSKRTLLSCPWGHFVHRFHRASFVRTALWDDLQPVEWLIHKMSQNIFMQTATWLVPRDLAEVAGDWNTDLLSDDDGEYFCRILLASDGVRFVPDARVFYRRTGRNSLSYVGDSDKKLDALFLSMQLHIGYLRSLEDSPRVRRACANYMQDLLILFYPQRNDIVEQLNMLASNLGEQLTPPKLSWKYDWIRVIFGWSIAKRAQRSLPGYKWSMIRAWDRIVFLIDSQNLAAEGEERSF